MEIMTLAILITMILMIPLAWKRYDTCEAERNRLEHDR